MPTIRLQNDGNPLYPDIPTSFNLFHVLPGWHDHFFAALLNFAASSSSVTTFGFDPLRTYRVSILLQMREGSEVERTSVGEEQAYF